MQVRECSVCVCVLRVTQDDQCFEREESCHHKDHLRCTWNAPEMISLQLTMIKRYLSMSDIATYPKQFPSNHRRKCFPPSNHGSTLFSPSSTVMERHNPVTLESPIASVKAISAVFGHSVYLRFRDTTTNNALTTIGVVSTMSSAWSHEEKWCVCWGLGTWCYLSTSTNL